MRTHGAVVGRRFRSVTKLTTKVRIGRGYLWGSFRIAAAALKTPTRNGYNAQGVNLNFNVGLVPRRSPRTRGFDSRFCHIPIGGFWQDVFDMHTYIPAYTHTHICILYVYIHIYIYINMYIFIFIYTHIYVDEFFVSQVASLAATMATGRPPSA